MLPFEKPLHGILAAGICSVAFLLQAPSTFASDSTEITCPGGDKVCRLGTGLPLRALPRALSNLYKEPDASSEILASNVTAFRPVYVFERKDIDLSDGANPKGWYRVGSTHKDPAGWMQARDILEWKHALVVSYKHPGSGEERRQPVLMFKSKEALDALVSAPDRAEQAHDLYQGLTQNPPQVNEHLISREPSRFVSIEDKFYLLPVINFEKVEDVFDDEARYLEIAAALPVQEGVENVRSASGNEDTLLNEGFLEESALTETTAGTDARNLVFDIKFVMDMTEGMDPHIYLIKEAVKEIAQTMSRADSGVLVRYGLVGYRDDVKQIPQLGFTARNFTPTLVTADQFANAVKEARAATISSGDYSEEAFAGIQEALESPWDENSIRIVILIGDASSHPVGHPQNTTGMNATELREKADANKVHIIALHLQRPQASPDFDTARIQFSTLASNPGSQQASYLPIPADNHDEFEKAVRATAEEFSRIVAMVRQGDTSVVQSSATSPSGSNPGSPGNIEQAARKNSAQLAASAVVSYLGNAANPPRDITAWVLDRDLINPNDISQAPLDVRVLVKKKDLNDLIISLETILKAVKRSQLTGKGFFASVQGAMALVFMGGEVNFKNTQRLAESGLLPYWLESLPYRSYILDMSDEVFESLAPEERANHEYDIESKLKFYQEINEDTDKWIALDERDAPIDHVYPLPLSLLP